MMSAKVLLPFMFMWLCAVPVSAQVPSAQPSPQLLQTCLLGTPPALWTRLKLSSDQVTRITAVQEACKEECDVPGVQKVPNPISTADGTTVMEEVRSILTTDQYRAWVEYCAAVIPSK